MIEGLLIVGYFVGMLATASAVAVMELDDSDEGFGTLIVALWWPVMVPLFVLLAAGFWVWERTRP